MRKLFIISLSIIAFLSLFLAYAIDSSCVVKPGMTIHNLDPNESILSKFVQFCIYALNFKPELDELIKEGVFDDTPERIPFFMARKLNINYTKFEDRHYWILQPKTGATDKVVLYVHGGAYIHNIIFFQWLMVDAIISRTNATFIIPDYEIAPRWTYTKMFSFIQHLYLQILEKNAPEKVYLLGDSAGGGFVLSLAMSLRDMKQPLPSKIFMVSPWVDLSMTNQDCYKNDKVDTMTSISGLIQAGKLFAGDLDLKDPRVSPLYGDLHNLPNISIYSGTHDVLNPDVRLLRDRFLKDNIPLNYYEFPHMFHVFPAVPFLREAKIANQNIADAILE